MPRFSTFVDPEMQILDAARSSFTKAHANGTKFERMPLFEPLSSLPHDAVLHEAIDIIIAGSDTTATTLGNLITYVLADPDVLQKLRTELDTALPQKDVDWPLAELERLEYLVSRLFQKSYRI
jgi:cytochrome P450